MIGQQLLNLLLLPMVAMSLNPIEIKGSKFFDSKTGEQFFMKGVAYQPRLGGSSDPLAIPNNCKRDAKYLKDMGINTIRVYESYPWNNHDECMKIFSDAGIYLLLDLAIPERSINREQPHYDTDIFIHHKQNVDAFSKYDNVLGFFAGNEVTNSKEFTEASAHIKALLRDMKAYVKTKSRYIPVGYANNDDPDVRVEIQDYFNCGSDEERADFYGINIYSWCGKSSFKESGYDKRTEEIKDYSIPSILSEYGCNTVGDERPFGDTAALYGDEMSDKWSGGIVYEYSEEDNKYGLVQIDKKGTVKTKPDYDTIKSHLSKAKPKTVKKDSYKPNSKKSSCPKINDNWKSGEKLPKTPSEAACECIYKSLECKVSDKGLEKDNGKKVGQTIGELCGFDGVCDSITMDVAKGKFGDYSFCSTKVRNSIAFNAAYKKGSKCDFNGFATKSSADKSSDNCAKLAPNLKDAPKPKKIGTDSTESAVKDSESNDSNKDKGPSSDGKPKAMAGSESNSKAQQSHSEAKLFLISIVAMTVTFLF